MTPKMLAVTALVALGGVARSVAVGVPLVRALHEDPPWHRRPVALAADAGDVDPAEIEKMQRLLDLASARDDGEVTDADAAPSNPEVDTRR
jgi:hypothetical protein